MPFFAEPNNDAGADTKDPNASCHNKPAHMLVPLKRAERFVEELVAMRAELLRSSPKHLDSPADETCCWCNK
jgi:hypothetical protein